MAVGEKRMSNCKHYDEEFDCCKILSDWSDPMPVLQPCVKGVCDSFLPVRSETCKNCEYWQPLENDPQRGVCSHPERNDKMLVYYFGSLKADDYCAKFSKKEK